MADLKPNYEVATPVNVATPNGRYRTVFAYSEGVSVDIELDKKQTSEQTNFFVLCSSAPTAHALSGKAATFLVPDKTEFPNVWKFSLEPTSKPTRFITSSRGLIRLLLSENGTLIETETAESNQPAKKHTFLEQFALYVLVALIIYAGLVYSNALEPFQKRLAVLLTAATVFASFFGIAITAKWFWRVIDVLQSKFGRRIFNSFVLSIGAFLLWSLAGPTKCLLDAYRFEAALSSATSSGSLEARYEDARRALVMFPNRIESYYVINRIIDDYRISNRALMRGFSQRIIGDEELENAISEFLNSDPSEPCACTRQSEVDLRHVQKQVLNWIYYRNAEAYGPLERPIDFVPSIEGKLSKDVIESRYFKLRKAVWDFESLDYPSLMSIGSDQRIRKLAIKSQSGSLAEIRENYAKMIIFMFGDPDIENDWGLRSDFPSDFLVQASLDKMVSHNIRICDFEKVRTYAADLLLLRQRSLDTGALWLEGPEKFETFNFFRLLRSSDDKIEAYLYIPAKGLLEISKTCGNWFSGANGEPGEAEKSAKFFRDNFPDWWKQNEEKWLKGSVESTEWSELRTTVISQANTNWRY